MLQYIIILPLVFLAGFIDAIAGGGGLISLPAYMLAGLPVHNAIATNKMSSTMGTAIATFKYAKDGFIPWKIVGPAIVGALLGSVCGANLSLIVSDYYFKIIMIVILPFIAYYVLKGKVFDEKEPYGLKKTMLLCGAIAFMTGIYDGFYGPGTGTFLILLFTGVAHLKLTSANGMCKAINLTTNISALTVFLINGKVIVIMGLIAGCFNIAGNYLGARMFAKGEAKFVKPVIMIVLAVFFVSIILELCNVTI